MTLKQSSPEQHQNNTRTTPEQQISIIVPVYNCEKYITKCLESLINQDCKTNNYEIIIINDGSTDSTGEICDSYADKFNFIHVTHTENFGVSHARNIALAKCRGNYIMSCDADDFAAPQLISVISKAIELYNEPDMLIYKYLISGEGEAESGNSDKELTVNDAKYYNSAELSVKILTDINIGGYSWNKVYKKSLCENIQYNEKLSVCEDSYFFIEMLANNRDIKACLIDSCLYYYVQHSDSGLSRTPERIYRSGDKLSQFVIAHNEMLSIKNISPEVRTQIEGLIYYWTTGNLYQMGQLITDDTRKLLKSYAKNYALTYYFRSKHSIGLKIRALIKHFISLFHISNYK